MLEAKRGGRSDYLDSQPTYSYSGADEAFIGHGKNTIEIVGATFSSRRDVSLNYEFNKRDRGTISTEVFNQRFGNDDHFDEVARFAVLIRNGNTIRGAGNSFRIAFPEIFKSYVDRLNIDIHGGIACFDGDMSSGNAKDIENQLRKWKIRVLGFPKTKPSEARPISKKPGVRKGLELVVGADNLVDAERSKIVRSRDFLPFIEDKRFVGVWVGEERIPLEKSKIEEYASKNYGRERRLLPDDLLEMCRSIYYDD